MPGGGLIQLISYGAQNVILSGNPDMTFFYKIYKKYTHFALENVSKGMDGPTDYPYQDSIQLRARIDRVGDLVSDIYFSFDIPAIYSKYQITDQRLGPTNQQEFKWVKALGAAAIQSVYITCGPNKIQEFTGEYLMSKAMVDYNSTKYGKWQQLVGDVPELNDPANGLYGHPTATVGEYPTVYRDVTNHLAQTNNPSIPATTIYVPLPFWFTEEGQALPLVGLQYYTVDVTINLTPSSQLYTVLDASGFRMAPTSRILSSQYSIHNNIPTYANPPNNSSQINNFFTDIDYTVPSLLTWSCNPQIHTTYVFLPESERNIFATTPLMYLTRQVTLVSFPEIINNQLLYLDIHNPITRIIILPRRSDVVLYKNNISNFTNWLDYPSRPVNPTPSQGSGYIGLESATGIIVPGGQLDIIQYLRILSDGNEIQELKPTTFFTNINQWKYLDGMANRHLPVYTFELHSPNTQPSGSLNSSRIRKFNLDLQVWPLPPNSTYIYSVNLYVENINFFIVESGMGDNKYAL